MLKRRLRRCEYQCGLSLLPAGGVAADRPRLRGGSPVLHSLSGQRAAFLALLFMGAVNSTGLLAMIAGPNPNADLFRIRSQQRPDVDLGLCHADRGSIHTFGEHSGAPHLRAAALGLLPRLSGGADSAAGCWGTQVVRAPVPHIGWSSWSVL